MEKEIFHGGCLSCESQRLYALNRCYGCKYRSAEWDLPDLCINEETISKIIEDQLIIVEKLTKKSKRWFHRDNLSLEDKLHDEEEKLDKLLDLKKKFNDKNKFEAKDGNRNLIVGDLHAPFILEGYLDFCLKIYNKYNCNNVVFIGDIIDNHASSFHESDPDGLSAGDELSEAKEIIRVWHDTFPNSLVCLGNHGLMAARKAMTGGLSKQWIKSLGEVLDTPTWEYGETFYIDDVMYCHGTGKKAKGRAKNELISVVQGHYHSESYIEHLVGKLRKIFALQVGCGIDKDSYAMAYGKHFPKPHINVGVVLEDGTLPILEYMDLV